MQYKYKYTRAIAILILGWFGVVALPVLSAAAPVIGNAFPSKPKDQRVYAVISGVTLAALEPASANAGNAGTGSATHRIDPAPGGRVMLSPEGMLVGTASFYDDPAETASGEPYDPDAFTAAAQLDIRDKFGGIKFGRLYQPAYAVGEYEGKKIIVKFNDVGPLRPGRKFDLSRAAMAYFDAGFEKGLLPDFRMTPLPLGQTYPAGPVTDEQLAALGIAYGTGPAAPADMADTPPPHEQRNLSGENATMDPADGAPWRRGSDFGTALLPLA